MNYLDYFQSVPYSYTSNILEPHSHSGCIARQAQYIPASMPYSNKWNSRRSLNGGYDDHSVDSPRRTICTFCLSELRKTNVGLDAENLKS